VDAFPDSTPDELTAVYARMSGVLLSEQTVATALQLITSLAVDTLPGSIGSGVSVRGINGDEVTSAATDRMVERADALQYELGQGPCLTAWHDGVIVRVDDVGTDPRWPLWSARVDSTGIRSVLSAPLVTADRSWGAIKVYSDRAGAYDETEVGLLRRFAAQAAILVANVHTFRSAERLSDNLKRALHTRDLIATAKGIVMLREQLDPDQAMRWLIEQSSLSGTTLATLAETLVEAAGDEAG